MRPFKDILYVKWLYWAWCNDPFMTFSLGPSETWKPCLTADFNCQSDCCVTSLIITISKRVILFSLFSQGWLTAAFTFSDPISKHVGGCNKSGSDSIWNCCFQFSQCSSYPPKSNDTPTSSVFILAFNANWELLQHSCINLASKMNPSLSAQQTVILTQHYAQIAALLNSTPECLHAW